MKQPDTVDRTKATIEMAGVVQRVLLGWFREHLSPPPTEHSVALELTSLGSISMFCPDSPPEVRRELFRLISALAWLYPGAGETKALRRLAELENKHDQVLEAVWSFTDLDPEHTLSCHADSVPAAYRAAVAAIEAAKTAGTPDWVSAPEKPAVQP